MQRDILTIAIIDSGVQALEKDSISIEQYRILDGKIEQEYPIDRYGHGTAVASIITKIHNLPQFYGPGGIEGGDYQDPVSSKDIAESIIFATNYGMGTPDFSNRRLLDDA